MDPFERPLGLSVKSLTGGVVGCDAKRAVQPRVGNEFSWDRVERVVSGGTMQSYRCRRKGTWPAQVST